MREKSNSNRLPAPATSTTTKNKKTMSSKFEIKEVRPPLPASVLYKETKLK